MSKVKTIEQEIEALSPEELVVLRKWFSEFDAETWERLIEEDAKAGKLDSLADAAIKTHQGGRSTKF